MVNSATYAPRTWLLEPSNYHRQGLAGGYEYTMTDKITKSNIKQNVESIIYAENIHFNVGPEP